jgi:hypothetical protein
VVGIPCDRDGQATLPAAELEDALTAEIDQPPEGGEVRTLGIEDRAHGL